jgi:hypothetical protein
LILVAVIGVFSTGERDFVMFFPSLASIIPFYLIFLAIRGVGGVIPIILSFSFFSSSRGIFVMFLPIILLFSAIYELPPLELKKKPIISSFLYSFFAGFLVFVAHAGAKTSFSLPSEVFQLSAIVIMFSFFDFLSLNIKNRVLKKLSGAVACVIPSLFLGYPEDILVGIFFGALYIRWELEIFKFLAGAYFTSKYSYLKYKLSSETM